MGPLTRPLFSLAAHYLRIWDYASAGRVDHFVANSQFVASRIQKVYGRQSCVIYPPVSDPSIEVPDRIGDYYLAVGRLVDYKRFDLAVEACTRTGRRLRIVGDGPQYRALRRLAGSTVQFLGPLGDSDLQEQFAACRALLFPGEEDFGIVPVEAQTFGRPVIAYGSGGALETVLGFSRAADFYPEATGVFFSDQSVESLLQGMQVFEICESRFSRSQIQGHSKKFGIDRFKSEFGEYVSERWAQFKAERTVASISTREPIDLHLTRSV
jgi:glycosyltransferase involved in cell wall biosynthesis